MPGRARMYLPDYPYHIVQRGNNRSLFKHHLDDVGIKMIRKAAHYCHPIGDDRFKEEIERKYGITLGQDRRGRPKQMGDVVNI